MEGPTRSGVSSSVASSSNSAVRRSAGGRRVVADDDEAGRHIDAGLAPQRERLLVVPVERNWSAVCNSTGRLSGSILCKVSALERSCRYVPLANQPLVLVLGQVRFSPVRQMNDYIPAIQEEFRRHGFPLERAGKVQQLIFGPSGGVPVQVVEEQRWEYRTRDETWSILVMQKLRRPADHGLWEVRGLRRQAPARRWHGPLEDRARPVRRRRARGTAVRRRGPAARRRDFRFYLRPGFHGVADDVFRTGTHRLHVESTGRTSVGDVPGTLIVRVVQNDQGVSLPPDLVGGAPKLAPRGLSGELITLIDMDHYIEGNFEPDVRVGRRAYVRDARSHRRDVPRARGHRRRRHGLETVMPLSYSSHEAESRSLDATYDRPPLHAHGSERDAWRAMLWRACSGSTGVVLLGSALGSFLPHVGSSSSIVDYRFVAPASPTNVAASFREIVALPVIEQMQELQAALSLNKAQLAGILRVARPTLYDWLRGREPNGANAGRVDTLLRILARASVSSASPLNARFVARRVEIDAPSLVELLGEESLDEDRVVRAIERSRALADSASRRRTAREERLRTLGFEELGGEQRRRQLATNVALRKWPERSSETT